MPETAEQEEKRSLGPWWLCGATTPAPALDSESHVVSKGKKNPKLFCLATASLVSVAGVGNTSLRAPNA